MLAYQFRASNENLPPQSDGLFLNSCVITYIRPCISRPGL